MCDFGKETDVKTGATNTMNIKHQYSKSDTEM
jgi:hypothetical protein